MSDEDTAFVEYEQRFSRLVGAIEPGQYGQFRGRLVRRLAEAQFADKHAEYKALGADLMKAISAGDTIDETIALELRAAEVDLVMEKSGFFPSF